MSSSVFDEGNSTSPFDWPQDGPATTQARMSHSDGAELGMQQPQERGSDAGGSFGSGRRSYNEMSASFVEEPAVMTTREHLVLINHFLVTTADFLNRVGVTAEYRLQQLSQRISRLNTELIVLENKLSKIPGLENVGSPSREEDRSFPPTEEPSIVGLEPHRTPTETQHDDDPDTVQVKDHTDYAYYFKLLWEHNLPAEHVKMKMEQNGVKPSMLDDPYKKIPRASTPGDRSMNVGPAAASDAQAAQQIGGREENVVKIEDDPQYVEFFKMLRIGLPTDAVKQKMILQGVDPSILDRPEEPSTGGNYQFAGEETGNSETAQEESAIGAGSGGNNSIGVTAANNTQQSSENQVDGELLIKDDPQYAEYFKMLRIGLPPDAVKQKMELHGVDPSILDRPDEPSPNQGSLVPREDEGEDDEISVY